MTEPNSRPEIFTDWAEWRSVYDLCKFSYIAGHLERTRARAMLTTLGYKLHEATAELDQWEGEGKGMTYLIQIAILMHGKNGWYSLLNPKDGEELKFTTYREARDWIETSVSYKTANGIRVIHVEYER